MKYINSCIVNSNEDMTLHYKKERSQNDEESEQDPMIKLSGVIYQTYAEIDVC